MNPTGRTEPTVTVITGAAGGIGAAVARRLARDGHHLALVDRPGPALEALAAELRDAGHPVLTLDADVRDPAATELAAAAVENRFGGFDALVTCAGIGRIDPIDQTTDEIWADTLATNLSGTFWWCRAAVPRLRRRGGGVIVPVSSTTALVGLPGRSAYAAAKAGVLGLARTLAVECAADGIRVVPVCPGATRTDLVRQGYARAADPAAAERAHAALQPIGRLSEPEEIAETIAFVCSSRAATITGATLVVDGGYTAGGPSWNT
ncbi:SDR family NAD(P)-dependent oxidoreductase [Micromonospora craniellae]|uniref:SDR family oxidoreductase n=1 Tax=Micromonospora craniellae TaxID=2294034 RepID=A0A372G4R9_9ACTN|nr:SDR family oxidoreductase [Micromonospora craniellae]QOC92990.1 SDR family oxidoreductase [Micromonospora craniellae]RFS47769.1 SDR family oxidoreductase [Micromonospora craniellae]